MRLGVGRCGRLSVECGLSSMLCECARRKPLATKEKPDCLCSCGSGTACEALTGPSSHWPTRHSPLRFIGTNALTSRFVPARGSQNNSLKATNTGRGFLTKCGAVASRFLHSTWCSFHSLLSLSTVSQRNMPSNHSLQHIKPISNAANSRRFFLFRSWAGMEHSNTEGSGCRNACMYT